MGGGDVAEDRPFFRPQRWVQARPESPLGFALLALGERGLSCLQIINHEDIYLELQSTLHPPRHLPSLKMKPVLRGEES